MWVMGRTEMMTASLLYKTKGMAFDKIEKE
jgi:hypothetical protein